MVDVAAAATTVVVVGGVVAYTGVRIAVSPWQSKHTIVFM
jgi:hypothetical protein